MNAYSIVCTNDFNSEMLIVAESIEKTIEIFHDTFPNDNITEIKLASDYVLVEKQ